MLRRSATMGLMMTASLKAQATVGVLSLQAVGVRQAAALRILGKPTLKGPGTPA